MSDETPSPDVPPSLPALPVRYSASWANGALHIQHKWSLRVAAVNFFSASVFGFPFVEALSSGTLHSDLAFLAFSTLASAALLITSLWFLVNRSTVLAQQGWLTVRHGPLPWFGLQVKVEDVTRCDVKVHSRHKGGSPRDYKVFVKLRTGKEHTLLGSIPQESDAHKLEAIVEKTLGVS